MPIRDDSGMQDVLLGKAERLQIQLTARLETSGYHNISKLFSDEIQPIQKEK